MKCPESRYISINKSNRGLIIKTKAEIQFLFKTDYTFWNVIVHVITILWTIALAMCIIYCFEMYCIWHYLLFFTVCIVHRFKRSSKPNLAHAVMPDEKSETAEKWLNEMKKEVMKVGLFLVENFYSLPRTLETWKELIKCRFLNLLIIEFCRYLVFFY